jgi:hypothetical protein
LRDARTHSVIGYFHDCGHDLHATALHAAVSGAYCSDVEPIMRDSLGPGFHSIEDVARLMGA